MYGTETEENNPPNESVVFKKGHEKIRISIKRLDLNHAYGLGNKYYKLKYNVIEAKKKGATTLVTFGGAYSNHILATAIVGKEEGFKTVGIIRGEELSHSPLNPTLYEAQSNGMDLVFISRDLYREVKTGRNIGDLINKYPNCYILPEGGTNEFAVLGTEEILNPKDFKYEYICLGVGTGGTISGVIRTSKAHQKIIGIPVLNGGFLNSEIKKYTQNTNWQLCMDYHFGGYAKTNSELIQFIKDFKLQTDVSLDPIYMGKVLYGTIDMILKGAIPKETSVLVIHTGGKQGLRGFSTIFD